MNERVEEIRRRHDCPDHPMRGGFREPCYVCDLLTALAQAEREREFERERADNQHEAAEMFQNQYREALQERDHSRGLVNGLIAERNNARAEVERLKGENRRLRSLDRDNRADLARVRAATVDECIAHLKANGFVPERWWDQMTASLRAALEGR